MARPLRRFRERTGYGRRMSVQRGRLNHAQVRASRLNRPLSAIPRATVRPGVRRTGQRKVARRAPPARPGNPGNFNPTVRLNPSRVTVRHNRPNTGRRRVSTLRRSTPVLAAQRRGRYAAGARRRVVGR